MQEYVVKYLKDGELADGGIFTGGFGMKNARQCARAAIRAKATESVIIDTATDAVAARFTANDAGEVEAAEVAEGLTGTAWSAGFGEQDAPNAQTETNEQGETANQDAPIAEDATDAEGEEPAFEDLKLDERGELGLGKTRIDPIGENGMSANAAPEDYIYRAELGDPDCPDRMEIFRADCDEDAIKQALEICAEATDREVVLLELHLLDEDYEFVRSVDLCGETESETPQAQSERAIDNSAPNRREVDGTEENAANVITISLPMTGFDPAKIDNLCKMVKTKESLIRAALGLTNDAPLPIRIDDNGEQLHFPWFPLTSDGDTVKAYATFIQKLCETAKKKTRVTAKEQDDLGDSPKFKMRCWLIALGMIGPDFKFCRKALMSRLSGNASFSNDNKYAEMQAKRRKPAADTENNDGGEDGEKIQMEEHLS